MQANHCEARRFSFLRRSIQIMQSVICRTVDIGVARPMWNSETGIWRLMR